MAPGAGPVHVGPGKEGACGRGSRRVPPAFMELFGAGGVFFTLRGEIFANGEGEGGDGRGEAQPGRMR